MLKNGNGLGCGGEADVVLDQLPVEQNLLRYHGARRGALRHRCGSLPAEGLAMEGTSFLRESLPCLLQILRATADQPIVRVSETVNNDNKIVQIVNEIKHKVNTRDRVEFCSAERASPVKGLRECKKSVLSQRAPDT